MRHVKVAILLASGLLTAAAAARAQEKNMEPPKPGPEHQRLGFFAGNWKSEAEMKPGPWGAGGKVTGESRCSWMQGGYFVVCHETASGAMGKIEGLGVMGYDTNAKQYTWNGFNSMGENERAVGKRDGKTWTYEADNMMGGKSIKGRYTLTETSPTSYDFKLETSEDGRTWTGMLEGKVTKQAAAKK